MKTENSSEKPAKKGEQPTGPSSTPPSENAEFEPEFIDSTEDNHVLIIAGLPRPFKES